ncbi:putative ABC transport system permease protein [Streptomyces umbrinus]|uniref:FtsX-like permease family protein n=1 Tax=Streptomyces umbrinus TaxID=67370 RepID=UPI0019BE3F39|nr:FtsX-like permease family protein [Streptomyces umbrinus]MCR3730690.1 putative ABC transport system permease protein [Streptomyces umbrinus]GHH38314.1 membrane protein [Streptomyces umbrinus]
MGRDSGSGGRPGVRRSGSDERPGFRRSGSGTGRRPGFRRSGSDKRPGFRRRDHSVAPWIRTRLRTAPGAAVALALLVMATACLAAAFPRAVERYEDAGLRRAVVDATAPRTSLQVSAPQPGTYIPQSERESAVSPASMRKAYERVLNVVERPLAVDPAQSMYGVRNVNNLEAAETWLPMPSGLPAQMSLAAQSGLAEHSRMSAGRLPRAGDTVTAATREVEAAVTTETAKRLNIKVGSVIHVPGMQRDPLAVRITGIVAPRDPESAYWTTQPLLRTPSLIRPPTQGGEPETYWLGALLLPPDAAPVLLGTPGEPARYWLLTPDPAALTAHDLSRLGSAVASLESGPGLVKVRDSTDADTGVSTDLDEVLASYAQLRSGVRPLVSVAAFGTGAVAVVVLLMAGRLTADRRRTELALLRARGASLRGLTRRLVTETAVVALPAGALGLAGALLLVPYGRAPYAVGAALAVTLLACAALPLRALAAHRVVGVHGAREDLASVRPSRRRTIAELTLLVLASAAVLALRSRGTSGTSDEALGSGDLGSSGDQLVAMAPVLIGVIAALVLVRLYPLPLRWLARPAGRMRGAIGHLSLARAGRTSVSTVLPLLALLTALTTAAFGGSVLAGVADARDRAAVLNLGADARVEAESALPATLPERVRSAPGVQEVTPLSIAYEAKPGAGVESVPLAGVDPEGYARLADRTGLGAFPAGELKASPAAPADGASKPGADGSAKAPLPALASSAVADRYGTHPFSLRLSDGSDVTVRITLVRDLTPALPGTDFLIVDRAGLGTVAARPTTLLVTGDQVNGGALRKAVAAGTGADTDPTARADVRLRSEERARYVDSPLQSGAERVYAAAVAAGSGYAVLALLLALVRAAPERAALLARLRTMGLTRSQGRRLLVLEALPQALLAAAGGILTGWAAVRLLAPGIDLTSIALATPGGAPPTGTAALHTDPASLFLPALTVLLLATGIAAGQAWWTGRRGSVRELRAGDSR